MKPTPIVYGGVMESGLWRGKTYGNKILGDIRLIFSMYNKNRSTRSAQELNRRFRAFPEST
jgi:hypothetical protein